MLGDVNRDSVSDLVVGYYFNLVTNSTEGIAVDIYDGVFDPTPRRISYPNRETD